MFLVKNIPEPVFADKRMNIFWRLKEHIFRIQFTILFMYHSCLKT